jgi:Protein of unknown function (DUF1552)
MLPRAWGAANPPQPNRMICVCTALGLHAPLFFPDEVGRDYRPSPYLDLLKEHRDEFTVFSGFAHPGNEAAGHSSEVTFLTAAANPQLPGFHNGVSLDQFIADKIGIATRFPSLEMNSTTSLAQSLAVNRSGVNLPSQNRPSQVFAQLFLDGTPEEVKREEARLAEGRSVLDAVSDQAKRLGGTLGPGDRNKLDEYLTSVREMEARLQAMESWVRKPKPKVNMPPPNDIQSTADLIGRMDAMFNLMPLALQTDSTRVITMFIGEAGGVPPIPGVTMGHHALSHHGMEPEKIAQLRRIEEAEMKSFDGLLKKIKGAVEGGQPVQRNTSVLLGSNLGNASNHSTASLPILLAGGGFKHGQHLAVAPQSDPKRCAPLSNLFVSIVHRMGIEVDRFGTSTGTVTGLERA